MTQKRYEYKVFSFPGLNFLGSLNYKRAQEPSFSWKANGGQGQLRFKYTIPFDDFDASLLTYMNLVRVYEIDTENPLGRLIYTGFISQYAPYTDGSEQGVNVTLLGLVSFLSFAYYKNGSNYTVTHSSEDPADIMKAIIDHFNTVYALTSTEFPNGLISYAGGNIDTVGTNVDIEFEDQRWNQAFDKVFGYVPEGWYWRIGPDGEVYLKQKPSSPTHLFTLGRDVETLEVTRNTEKIKNLLTFRDSGAGVTTFQDATSQSAYGVREEIYTASETADPTSISEYGDGFIGNNKDPKQSARMNVNAVYDLESILPGETCKVSNFKLGASVLDSNVQIVSVSYTPDKATLMLEQDITFGKELQNFFNNQ